MAAQPQLVSSVQAPSTKMLQVSAFQIDGMALLTVHEGTEKVTSGAFPVRRLQPDLVEIDFDEAGRVPVKILSRNDDPEVVGPPYRPGQVRVRWSGEFELVDA